MTRARFSRLEQRIMDALWQGRAISIREIQESFPAKGRPAYTTIQTTVYRLEAKGAVRRARKIGNAAYLQGRGDARCHTSQAD